MGKQKQKYWGALSVGAIVLPATSISYREHLSSAEHQRTAPSAHGIHRVLSLFDQYWAFLTVASSRCGQSPAFMPGDGQALFIMDSHYQYSRKSADRTCLLDVGIPTWLLPEEQTKRTKLPWEWLK